MSHVDINIIDPLKSRIPDLAIVKKVFSDEDKLPEDQHERAVKGFLISDGIASGIGKDLAFVDQIPQFIKEIIDNKLWECLYVAKGVVTPYYCRYTKGSDSENFGAFITAKRPNGLESSVETIERVLQADPEVLRKFRAIIYEPHQGERTDLDDETSYGHRKKLEQELSQTQRSVVRAANRAAEAIPAIGELLDRRLIAIDVAAQLGRDIKDPKNLTAEEREYVDKRDLIGLRLNQYIHNNTIPEDEDQEPAYSRELNRFVKDLLGIKDRSKSVRMDDAKKAAEKLLIFYQGDQLRELINCLKKGLESSQTTNNLELLAIAPAKSEDNILPIIGEVMDEKNNNIIHQLNNEYQENETENNADIQGNSKIIEPINKENKIEQNILENQPLKLNELAQRFSMNPKTLSARFHKYPDTFSQWTQKKDPDGIAWKKLDHEEKRRLFVPIFL